MSSLHFAKNTTANRYPEWYFYISGLDASDP